MRTKKLIFRNILLIFLVFSNSHIAQAIGTVTPEIPAVLRDIVGVKDNQYSNPHIAPLRTSADGRIAVNNKQIGGVAFYLVSPEKIGSNFVTTTNGDFMLSSKTPYLGGLDPMLFYSDSRAAQLRHGTICDRTSARFSETGNPSPKACGKNDCYELTYIGVYVYREGSTEYQELWGTPITVSVKNPKTKTAIIESITTGTPVKGARFPLNDILEPIVSGDQRFLLFRSSDSSFTWKDTTTNTNRTENHEILYSVYPESFPKCDVTQWKNIWPLSHAPYHDDVVRRYGFAKNKFRDSEGRILENGEKLHGTYPWIDKAARNVVFGTVNAKLYRATGGTITPRYPASCMPGVSCQDPNSYNMSDIEEVGGKSGGTRGYAIAGLWTNGKIVQLDGSLNKADYGLRMPIEKHRAIQLYKPNSGSSGQNNTGKVQIGALRDSSTDGPTGWVQNTTFFESIENLFNFNKFMVPKSPNDVVWFGTSGTMTDEISFDNWLDKDAFIVSSMVGATNKYGTYYDGFGTTGFTEEIRLQNAATGATWRVPNSGVVKTEGRLEPVALGGLQGKGFWLSGKNAIEYQVPSQTKSFNNTDWYYGIHIDPRMPNDSNIRSLISFPDGSEIAIRGLNALVVYDTSGAGVKTFTLATQLAARGFSHLALQVKANNTLEIIIDGGSLEEWTMPRKMLSMESGFLTLGKKNSSRDGVLGWIDDFTSFSRVVEFERRCNLANGSLMGLTSAAGSGALEKANQSAAFWHTRISNELSSNGKTTYSKYICLRNRNNEFSKVYDLLNTSTGQVSIRSALNFPEGPLKWNKPRPNSSANKFCLTCHTSSAFGGLGLGALAATTLDSYKDIRRQPMEPVPYMSGHIPAGLINGRPAENAVTPKEGLEIDTWSFP